MVNAEETQRVCGLKKEDFQTTVNGKKNGFVYFKE